ncbi:hypothetical protein Lal_00000966 [Lupinus albus]|nr:hypothetical protein Lal_00000966 [Lupinus albus]
MEAKDLSTTTLATLFEKSEEHEMEPGRLTLHEEIDHKKKGISLKATTSKIKKVEEGHEENSSNSS